MAASTECAGVDASPALAAAGVETRLAFLRGGFDREVGAIHLWSFVWGGLYGALSIVQAVWAASLEAHPARPTLIFGAIAAAVGSLSAAFLPLKLSLPMTRLRWTLPDRCELLRRAEKALGRVSHHQRIIKGASGHIGNVLFNLALLLTLGLAFGQWQSGFIAAGIGVLVGELNVRTQPRGAIALSQRYHAAELEPHGPPPPLLPAHPALAAR